MIPSDYTSQYNILRDEIFLYFMKQITPGIPEKFPTKTMYAYLFGFSVFSRYFCPSPLFIYPMAFFVHFLYTESLEKSEDLV